MMMGFGSMGLLMMLLFWGLLIAGAFWLVKSIFPEVRTPNQSAVNDHLTAREILDQRYARGEISREQYQVMIDDLQNTGEQQ